MLLIDDRAGSSELAGPLEDLGLDVDLTRLEFGDVAFAGRGLGGADVSIGIEFKQLGECVTSLRNERLQGHQLPGMRASYDYSYLLIEGPWLYDAQGRLQRRSKISKQLKPLAGAMTISELLKRIYVLHLAGGLNPIMTACRKDTVQAIHSLYRTWTDKALDEHKSHLAIYTPPAPFYVTVTPAASCAQGVDGVGWQKAHAIAKHFKTVKRMVDADLKAWLKVPGVGPELAARLLKALHEEGD
jgi:ERCC4-type nuclease